MIKYANQELYKNRETENNQNSIQKIYQNFFCDGNIDLFNYVNKWGLKFKNNELQQEYMKQHQQKEKQQFSVTLIVIFSLTVFHHAEMKTFFIEYTFYYCFLFIIALIQWKIQLLQPYMLSLLQLSCHAGFFYFYEQYASQFEKHDDNDIISISDQISTGILIECNQEAAIRNKLSDLKDFDDLISGLRVEKQVKESSEQLKQKIALYTQPTLKDYLIKKFWIKQRNLLRQSRASINQQNAHQFKIQQNLEIIFAKRIFEGLEDNVLYKISIYSMKIDQLYFGISITDVSQNSETENEQSIRKASTANSNNIDNEKKNILKSHVFSYISQIYDKIHKVAQQLIENNKFEDEKVIDYNELNLKVIQNIIEIQNQLQSVLIYCNKSITVKRQNINMVEFLKEIFFCMRSHVFIINSQEQVEEFNQVLTDPVILKYLLYSIVLNIYANIQKMNSQQQQNDEINQQYQSRIAIVFSQNQQISQIKILSPIKLIGENLFNKLNNCQEFNQIEKNVLQEASVIIQGKREIITEQTEEVIQKRNNQEFKNYGDTTYIIDIPFDSNYGQQNHFNINLNQVDQELPYFYNFENQDNFDNSKNIMTSMIKKDKKQRTLRSSQFYVRNLEKLVNLDFQQSRKFKTQNFVSQSNQQNSFTSESKKIDTFTKELKSPYIHQNKNKFDSPKQQDTPKSQYSYSTPKNQKLYDLNNDSPQNNLKDLENYINSINNSISKNPYEKDEFNDKEKLNSDQDSNYAQQLNTSQQYQLMQNRMVSPKQRANSIDSTNNLIFGEINSNKNLLNKQMDYMNSQVNEKVSKHNLNI